MTDEQQVVAEEVPTDDEQVPATREYIEYLGEEPHGTAFLTAHTLPKGDQLWKRSGLKVTKDVTWERDPYGPGIGQKGNRMLVAVEDLPDGTAEVLEKLPMYKRVND
jgi:hypothetical protein